MLCAAASMVGTRADDATHPRCPITYGRVRNLHWLLSYCEARKAAHRHQLLGALQMAGGITLIGCCSDCFNLLCLYTPLELTQTRYREARGPRWP